MTECIKYRKVEAMKYPENFVFYYFTKEEMDVEIKDLLEINTEIVVNVCAGQRFIVLEKSVYIEISEEKKEPETETKINLIELEDMYEPDGCSIYTLKDFDKFIEYWHKGKNINVFVLNGIRMIIYEHAIYQELKKNVEHDKQYV